MSTTSTVRSNFCGGVYDFSSVDSLKANNCLNTIRLRQTTGMQTPESLSPPPRYTSNYGDTCCSSVALNYESSVDLYRQPFLAATELRVGHFSGAITLLWFTPVDKLASVIQGGARNATDLSLGLSPQFLRYTKYLVQTSRIPLATVKTALLYILRFRQRCRMPTIGAPSSEARLLAVALMTADKYVDDVSYTTSTWAKISKIELQEMRKMEAEFLRGIKFDLHITEKEWQNFENALVRIFSLVDILAFA